VGVEAISKFKLDSAAQRELRQSTFVGIVVVGLEEGSAPSTEVMNNVRDQLVSEIQTEFDKIVRDVTVPIADITDPNRVGQVSNNIKAAVMAAVKQVIDQIRDRL